MVKVLVTLILRLVAYVLVMYGLTSTEFAVAITSDPDLMAVLTGAVSAGVVIISEVLARYIGGTPTKFLLGFLEKYLRKVSEKLVIRKTPSK